MKALTPCQHGEDGQHAFFAGLRLLGGLKAIGDGVGVRLAQTLEEGLRLSMAGKLLEKVFRDDRGTGGVIGPLPPAVLSCRLDFFQPRRLHPSRRDQALSVPRVDAGPTALRVAPAEPLQPRAPVLGPFLAVDPAV